MILNESLQADRKIWKCNWSERQTRYKLISFLKIHIQISFLMNCFVHKEYLNRMTKFRNLTSLRVEFCKLQLARWQGWGLLFDNLGLPRPLFGFVSTSSLTSASILLIYLFIWQYKGIQENMLNMNSTWLKWSKSNKSTK
jgi:pullulanase/glycogen debranching enzyme